MLLMAIIGVTVLILSVIGLELVDSNSKRKTIEEFCKIECK